MIEDLIETGQYKEALQYLNDMDNEQVRYQRLVCLYGLKELQQAKREGMKAKVLAGETYYDVVAIYVSILKDLEEFEEAINIIVEDYQCLIFLINMKQFLMQLMMNCY